MATPGVPTPSPVQPATAEKKGTRITVRLDDQLLDDVDAFADELGVERSEAVRMLLSSSLGHPEKTQAIREATFKYARLQHAIIGRLARHMQDGIETIVHEALENNTGEG